MPHALTGIVLFLPFAAAALAPVLARRLGHRAVLPLALAPLAGFVHFLMLLPAASKAPLAGGWPWAPSLGLAFSWYLDGLSLLFALLITGIGTLIIVYCGGYLAGDPRLGRLLSFMFLFMGSMLGLVLADASSRCSSSGS